ncbi:hypothetical protein HIC20_02965 [Buchnera aphidicola (Hormaphis cornu)]|nr:hypothetical protein HIC20_02965 [Buchnera aphidicola (Hormaphis cornu)]
MNINSTTKIIIFALIESCTEMLPISSTGHLILINYFLNIPQEQMNLFEAFAQLGFSMSLLILYWKKWSKKIFFPKIRYQFLKKKNTNI